MGPALPTQDVYLRTAVAVGPRGLGALRPRRRWPEYRWGVFLAEREPRPADRLRRAEGRAGLAAGARRVPRRPAAADRHPGRHRAGVGGAAAPARRDRAVAVRPAQPVPGQRRGGPAPLGDGLPAARLLRPRRAARRPRRCCSATPATSTRRASSARSTRRRPDWLSFFMFTYFTDRDGKYQLGTLKESAFDPLSRTCEFMLKEEAHHMFVGTTGVDRVVAAHRRADARARHRRHRPARRHPAGRDPEVRQLPLLGLAGPVRLREVDERRQLLHRRAQGPLAGGAPQGRPRAHRGRPPGRARSATARHRPPSEVRRCSRSTTTCAPSTSPTARPGIKRWNRVLANAGIDRRLYAAPRRVQPAGRVVRRPPRHPDGRSRRIRRVGGQAATGGCPPRPTRPTSAR